MTAAMEVPRIATAELVAEASQAGDLVTVQMKGSADTRCYEALDGLLRRVHDEVLRLGTPEVVVDLRELEFMNSSCLKAFVSWLSNLTEVEAARQYRICFRSDDDKHWQRRSLSALACFAVGLVRIDTT
jgi:hypothetical protein